MSLSWVVHVLALSHMTLGMPGSIIAATRMEFSHATRYGVAPPFLYVHPALSFVKAGVRVGQALFASEGSTILLDVRGSLDLDGVCLSRCVNVHPHIPGRRA